MVFDDITEKIMQSTLFKASELGSEFVTPEHVLYACLDVPLFNRAVIMNGGSIKVLREDLEDFFKNMLPALKAENDTRSIGERISDSFAAMIESSVEIAEHMGSKYICLQHVILAMGRLKESFAEFFLSQQVGKIEDLASALEFLSHDKADVPDTYDEFDDDAQWPEDFVLEYARLMNEEVGEHNTLVGRDAELDRIIRILLRKEKNNPLLIGEPGVGKTSIVYGLVDRIEKGDVPDPLKKVPVYSLEVGALLAGTQYRGDFEKRFLDIMDALSDMDAPIVFIDEIHNLIGAGSSGSGGMDASNMMKPYLEGGNIRFIGATTYDEHKKFFAKNATLSRRFQKVDIKEPDEDEALRILEGIKSSYEHYHNVKYGKDVLSHAVHLSKEFIGGRYLPDKAIDLIDEAAAYRRMHPISGQKKQTVGKDVIETVLAEVGNIPRQTAAQSELDSLKDLYERITGSIYGQEEAVRRIVDAICMSRAGLLADNKPIAGFLFVGPTGVGKTEVAKVLAKELGVEFIRFDMSEYAEKHTVSKLIGSPAGYVGYDDGGLLTDAIRKTPHCVLLLDEIEKAHPDIYNVLLQVLDYASLTDNRGQKADFRNVIIIMTSNAGARMIGKQNIGFGASKFNDSVMMEEVKRVFTPEFRNRLSAVVTFNHMNAVMAGQITDKKIRELSERLKSRKVTVHVEEAAREYIVKRGVTKDYGGREIERVIDSEVKPLFVSEILFGSLKNGGEAYLTIKDGKPALEGRRSGQAAAVKKTIEPEDLINGKKKAPGKAGTKNPGPGKTDPKKPGPETKGTKKAETGKKLSQKVKRSSGKKEED